MPRTCRACGQVFEASHPAKRYCEPSCGIPEKTCVECKRVFTPERSNKGAKLCSYSCRNTVMARRNRTTQRINKPGGLNETERQKIAEARSSTHSGKGYVKREGRHVHRAVAEAVLGRPLRKGEVVHHEDRDKTNNDPKNLIVFPSQAMHARHHKLDHLGLPECDCSGVRLLEVI